MPIQQPAFKCGPARLGLKKARSLAFTDRQMELICVASGAYRRLFEISAASPQWASAHREWCDAAESLAVAIIKQLEVRHDRAN